MCVYIDLICLFAFNCEAKYIRVSLAPSANVVKEVRSGDLTRSFCAFLSILEIHLASFCVIDPIVPMPSVVLSK